MSSANHARAEREPPLPLRRQASFRNIGPVGLCWFVRGSCLGAANGVRVGGHRSRRRRMEAALVEVSASEPRERLLAFVDEVVRPLPHVRQRENALLYVRGLIEQGGRKSLQPTLFRLQETPARYESMQQFLADSPWDPALLVQACVERVAPEIGVTAWVIDDTGIRKDGRHSPGVKRQYSGTLGQIGNCQIAVSVLQSASRARCRLVSRSICRRSGATTRSAA